MASADYLQKYLSGNGDKKKKKKSKKSANDKGFKVFEEDGFLAVQSKNGVMPSDSDDDDVSKEVREKMQLAEKMKFTTDGFQEVKLETGKKSPSSRRKRHDSDESPSHREKSSPSPVRRRRHDSDESVPRNKRSPSPVRRKRLDSDESPPRRGKRSPSPARRKRLDSDEAPLRRGKRSPSPARRKRHDSDESLPRRGKRSPSPARRKRLDSDESPPRRGKRSPSPARRKRHDSDESLPRRNKRSPLPVRRRRYSDGSPPRNGHSPSPVRRNHHDSDESPPRRSKRSPLPSNNDLSPKRKNQRSPSPQKTLDGKKAGLVSAAEMRQEMTKLKEDERKKMMSLDEDVSGRYAETKHRSSYIKRGKRMNKEDEEKKEREMKKTEELKTKYEMWNRGVVQLQKRQEQLKEEERTMAEGFARYADDESMNEHLKEQLLEDDPMAELISKKRTKINIRKGLVYPTYQGQWPPNRYNIPPGYRWDGVDRSNGFESRVHSMENKRKAEDSAAYRAIIECQE